MTSTPLHGKSTRTWRVAFFGVSALLGFSALTLWIVVQRQAADREYASYETLCAMGATGDDWVSFREFITGRPPIVQIDIPVHVPPRIAFDALPNLRNLEALTLAYPSLSADQLETLQQLKLMSLRFRGSFPRDSDVSGFARLRDVRFLYVPSSNLSADAQSRLTSLLHSSRIEFE